MNGVATQPRTFDPLGRFALLAFAGAWGIELLLLAAGVRFEGPTAAIWLILVSVIPGAAGVAAAKLDPSPDALEDLVRRIRTWRVGLGSYGLAVGLPLVTVIASVAGSMVLGIEITPQPEILTAIPVILAANFAEETGWRGFVLPVLLRRMGALRASLLLGVIWFTWHVPVQLLIPGEDKLLALLAMLLQLTGLSILLTWLSIHGRKAVILAAAAHASFNVAGNGLALLDVEGQLILGIACLVLAAAVLAIGGPELMRPALAAPTTPEE